MLNGVSLGKDDVAKMLKLVIVGIVDNSYR